MKAESSHSDLHHPANALLDRITHPTFCQAEESSSSSNEETSDEPVENLPASRSIGQSDDDTADRSMSYFVQYGRSDGRVREKPIQSHDGVRRREVHEL